MLEVREIPAPEKAAADHVIVKMEACGIASKTHTA